MCGDTSGTPVKRRRRIPRHHIPTFKAANLVAFFIILNGLVASSRLVMKAHTNKELLIGFLCGTLPQIGLLYVWL